MISFQAVAITAVSSSSILHENPRPDFLYMYLPSAPYLPRAHPGLAECSSTLLLARFDRICTFTPSGSRQTLERQCAVILIVAASDMLIQTGIRAGLTSMPIMPWHGAPRFRGPPWAARIIIFLIFKFQQTLVNVGRY